MSDGNEKGGGQYFFFNTTMTTTTTKTPTTAKQCVQQTIQQALSNHASDFTSADLLREFRRQAELLGETERIRELLVSDPFEHWKENASLSQKIESLGERLQVVDVHRVVTLSGYSFIDAVLEIPKMVSSSSSSEERKRNVKEKLKKKMQQCNISDELTTNSSPTATPAIQLNFRYERRAEEGTRRMEPGIDPPTVWYSMDLSTDGIEPAQRLLWVQVWADGHRRTEHLAAVNLEGDGNDDSDGWEDMDDDDDQEDVIQEQKRQRMDDKDVEMKETNDPSTSDATTERADRYVAGIDPAVLQTFVESIGLMGSDAASEVTVFFLLMTFPFFEHEWDIIGYLLESVFGSASDGDDDDEEKNDEDDEEEDD